MNYIICSSSIRHILAYYCAVVKMFLAVSCACLFDTDRGRAGAFMTDPSGLIHSLDDYRWRVRSG